MCLPVWVSTKRTTIKLVTNIIFLVGQTPFATKIIFKTLLPHWPDWRWAEELVNEEIIPLMPGGRHCQSSHCVVRSTVTIVELLTNAVEMTKVTLTTLIAMENSE